MPRLSRKKLTVKSPNTSETREVETIEQALKDLAKEAKSGELQLPVTVSFDAPDGSSFAINITTPEAAQEISILGFMY